MNAVAALPVVGRAGFARLATRAQTVTIKHQEHVAATQALGAGTASIAIHHNIAIDNSSISY